MRFYLTPVPLTLCMHHGMTQNTLYFSTFKSPTVFRHCHPLSLVCAFYVPLHQSHRAKHPVFGKIFTLGSLQNLEGGLLTLYCCCDNVSRILKNSSNYLNDTIFFVLHKHTTTPNVFPIQTTGNDISVFVHSKHINILFCTNI